MNKPQSVNVIPYGRHTIDDDDIDAVVRVLRSNFLTCGPAVERFEDDLKSACNASHAVACHSGTAALQMAYHAAGVGPGTAVIVPANTFLATANAAVHLGACVRFCDVDPETGLMRPSDLEQIANQSTNRDAVTVIAPVHFAGRSCDVFGIAGVRDRMFPRAVIVEDAAHALGATDVSRGLKSDSADHLVGSCRYSSMSTFSFHPVKHVAAGEGGGVTTNDPSLADSMRRYRSHGMIRDTSQMIQPGEGPWYYEMQVPGHNFRMSDISAALASSQMQN